MDAVNTGTEFMVRLTRSQEELKASFTRLETAIDNDPTGLHFAKLADPARFSLSNTAALESLSKALGTAIQTYIHQRVLATDTSRDGRMQNIKHIMGAWLNASYPFVDIVLSVAKESSSVYCTSPLSR